MRQPPQSNDLARHVLLSLIEFDINSAGRKEYSPENATLVSLTIKSINCRWRMLYIYAFEVSKVKMHVRVVGDLIRNGTSWVDMRQVTLLHVVRKQVTRLQDLPRNCIHERVNITTAGKYEGEKSERQPV